MKRTLALFILSALYLLRFDFWLWRSPDLILGIPAGLLYHFVFCILVALVLATLLRFLWPLDLPAADTDL